MGKFGESIGLPFALEGFAFFTEAIFLGIYLYGRGKVSPGMHLASGIAVAVSGAASALFVTLVSAFMNGPGGTDPIAAMASPSWPYQVVHVLLSCYQATAWAMVAIAGLHPAAQPDADAAPQGAGAGAADGLLDRARAAAVGRSFGQTPGGRAAAEAGRGRGAPAHRRARGAARGRHPRSRDRRVPRRASDPGRPVVPGVRRLRRDGDRARRVSARRMAAGAGACAPRSR